MERASPENESLEMDQSDQTDTLFKRLLLGTHLTQMGPTGCRSKFFGCEAVTTGLEPCRDRVVTLVS